MCGWDPQICADLCWYRIQAVQETVHEAKAKAADKAHEANLKAGKVVSDAVDKTEGAAESLTSKAKSAFEVRTTHLCRSAQISPPSSLLTESHSNASRASISHDRN